MKPLRTTVLAVLCVATGSACPARPSEVRDAGLTQAAPQPLPRALAPEQEQREAIALALAGATGGPPTDDAGLALLGPKSSPLGYSGDALDAWGAFERRLLATEPTVAGPLTREAVRNVAHSHRGQLRYCYQAHFADRDLDRTGDLTVKFEISPAGPVSASEVTQSSMGDAGLEACVAGRVRTWSFPQRRDGGVSTVTYPFHFER